MPDLDNLAKKVKGLWRSKALLAAVNDANRHEDDNSSCRLGQALAHVLARCALTYAGVQLLPAFNQQLQQLAQLPARDREREFHEMVFPRVPEGKDMVVKAARQVGILITDGKLEAPEVPLALARSFLQLVPEAEFFGVLTSEGYPKPFPTEAAAEVALNQARAELTAYIAGAAPEFAASMFTALPQVEAPELVRRDTAEQMETPVSINLSLLVDEDEDE